MLNTLTAWQQASPEQRKELIDAIEKAHPELKFDTYVGSASMKLPRFHAAFPGINFIYIPGGTYNMGFGDQEEKAARDICDPPPMTMEEMRPVTKKEIAPFLVSETPFLHQHALAMSSQLSLANVDEDNTGQPFFTEIETAEAIATALQARIPTEPQWEYFCRANTDTLFCFGNTVPGEDEMDKWLAWELSDLSSVNKNNFGIAGLFFSEWCADEFRFDYSENAKVAEDARAIRGGGAYFWPWQDEEWVWCASAMRMPSTDLINSQAVFRLVIEPAIG